MTYKHFEIDQKVNIIDKEEFKRLACGTCQNKNICDEWEMLTATTLFSNMNKETKKLHVSFDGKVEGVYRCGNYTPEIVRLDQDEST